jgi:riboflavin synthase
MFTGIIDHIGIIKHITRTQSAMTVRIETDFQDLVLGESIAVNGVCLTVTKIDNHIFECDLSTETLKLSNTQFFKLGAQVNLERSLRISDRLGGHFVYGHVDTMCTVSNIEQQQAFTKMAFSGLSNNDKNYFVKKGSVCVNGVSLTINEVFADGFEVMLIPHTLERTNLQFLQVDDKVNIEFDWLARIAINYMQQK